MKPLIHIILSFFFMAVVVGAAPRYSFFLHSSSSTCQAKPVNNKTDSIGYKIINVMNQCYGYDIYIHGRMVIHQPVVPCQPGKNGFRRKEDARKVALLVIGKIRRGEMPPAITLQEMKRLNVLEK